MTAASNSSKNEPNNVLLHIYTEYIEGKVKTRRNKKNNTIKVQGADSWRQPDR